MTRTELIHLERAIFQMEKATGTIADLCNKYPDKSGELCKILASTKKNIQKLKTILHETPKD